MPNANLCWGIEIGAGALKAIQLERDGDNVRVVDFAIIPHKRVLSSPDIDTADAVRVALGALVADRDFSGALVAVSVPGHQSFARFAKLPPVEPKKVPDIVKFEAVQQIPFPIEQVEWDFQTFASDDSPEVEVGIFAVTRERVMERLALLEDVGISPDTVTVGPVAAYNAVAYDLSFTQATPGVVIVDIGNTSTDLIVAEKGRVWIRTFPLGGHQFTETLVRAFKVDYTKAERLKRDIEQSKHRKQVFQAMRPAFEDLAQDIQRSLQYYKQLHPESDLHRMLGLGATFELPGLRKFLKQRLDMDVVRMDQFHRIQIEGPAQAEFHAASFQFATAYGLALQGLGLTPINANLIPVSVARDKVWKRKTPWVAAAAVLSLIAGAATFVRPIMDQGSVAGPRADAERVVRATVNEGNQRKAEWQQVASSTQIGYSVENLRRLFEGREYIPQILHDVGAMLASADPQPELLQGQTPSTPPAQWRIYRLQSLQIDSVSSRAGPPGGGAATTTARQPEPPPPAASRGRGGRGAQRGGFGGFDEAPAAASPITVTMVVDTPNAGGISFVNSTIANWLNSNAQRPGAPYRIKPFDASSITRQTMRSGGAAGTARQNQPGRQPANQPGAQQGGQGQAGPGVLQPGDVATLAPLPDSASVFPSDTEIHRYTIRFELEPIPPSQRTQEGEAQPDQQPEQFGAVTSPTEEARS